MTQNIPYVSGKGRSCGKIDAAPQSLTGSTGSLGLCTSAVEGTVADRKSPRQK